jgi:hypothetical protein
VGSATSLLKAVEGVQLTQLGGTLHHPRLPGEPGSACGVTPAGDQSQRKYHLREVKTAVSIVSGLYGWGLGIREVLLWQSKYPLCLRYPCRVTGIAAA